MDVSGQVHALAAEPQGKDHFFPLGQEDRWAQGTSGKGEERNISPLL